MQKRIVLIVLFLFLLVACIQGGGSSRSISQALVWKYKNLLLLDPVDGSSPTNDIVALYVNQTKQETIFRIDYLQLADNLDETLLIAIDSHPGGLSQWNQRDIFDIDWDYLIWITPAGSARIINEKMYQLSDVQLWVSKEPDLASVLVGFSSNNIISASTQVQIISISPSSTISDKLTAVNLNAPPPPKVPLGIFFWDSFPASTPAQALRSWAGAHSGKNSDRHGLSYLLNAVKQANVPITLIDVGKRQSWAILDYMGVTGGINELVQKGLLLSCNYREEFSYVEYDYAQYKDSDSVNTLVGFRKWLFERQNYSQILLGDDLQTSVFGDQDTSRALLSTVRYHTWLDPILQSNLCTKPAPLPRIRDPIFEKAFMAMRNVREVHIRKIAENIFLQLSDPDDLLPPEVRNNYLGEIGHLLIVSTWAVEPHPMAFCDRDIDWDGVLECVYATKDYITTIERYGGYIETMFVKSSNGLHQIIGPSFQLATILSDPSVWKLATGPIPDPNQVPGAFYNKMDTSIYDAYISDQTITLVDKSTGWQKEFVFHKDQIEFLYTGKLQVNFLIPLVLDPWVMDNSGWGNLYYSSKVGSSYGWGIKNQIEAKISTNVPLDFAAFNESQPVMQLPEDPNYAYPPGHYLPIPLAVSEIRCLDQCTAVIEFHED